MLLINGKRGGFRGRAAGAWTVWELPGVFLCVMHANPGPPRLQGFGIKRPLYGWVSSGTNSPHWSHCLIKFSRETPKAPGGKQKDGNQPVITRWAGACHNNGPHVPQRERNRLWAAARPNTSMHTDKYCQFNRSEWGWEILFLWRKARRNDFVLQLKTFSSSCRCKTVYTYPIRHGRQWTCVWESMKEKPI